MTHRAYAPGAADSGAPCTYWVRDVFSCLALCGLLVADAPSGSGLRRGLEDLSLNGVLEDQMHKCRNMD